MSNEAERLIFSRNPSGTFIGGMVPGISGNGENASLEVLRTLSYELVCPYANASVLGPLVDVGNVGRLFLSVRYLDGEISVGRYDRVSGFPAEQARALAGGNTEYQFSAVVCRSRVAERLDLRSETFTPMFSDDRDSFDDSRMFSRSLLYLCGMNPARLGAVHEHFDYVKDWLDEDRVYQAVLPSYVHVCRLDRSIVMSDGCWDALIGVFNVPDEQAPNCPCLAIRYDGAQSVGGKGGDAVA